MVNAAKHFVSFLCEACLHDSRFVHVSLFSKVTQAFCVATFSASLRKLVRACSAETGEKLSSRNASRIISLMGEKVDFYWALA